MSWTNHMRALAEYNRWANGKVFAVCEGMGDEDLRKDYGASHGSIDGLLHHMVQVQTRWFAVWSESAPEQVPDEGCRLDDLRDAFQRIDEKIVTFAESLTEDALDREIRFGRPEYGTFEARVWQVMAHGLNHSMQHRSEIGVMLGMQGTPPGDLDFLYFAQEREIGFVKVE